MFGALFGSVFSGVLGSVFNVVGSLMAMRQMNKMTSEFSDQLGSSTLFGEGAHDGQGNLASQAVGTFAESGNFNVLDRNQDNFIDKDELAAAARNDGNLYSEEQISAATAYQNDEKLFDHTENNGDGELDGRLGLLDFTAQRSYMTSNPLGYKATT
jgi:Ca2+-binding EF-hand superfamily protein